MWPEQQYAEQTLSNSETLVAIAYVHKRAFCLYYDYGKDIPASTFVLLGFYKLIVVQVDGLTPPRRCIYIVSLCK